MTGRLLSMASVAMLPRMLRPLAGGGLFFAEGAEWRRQRRQLAPAAA